jgi:hypothetical protein
MNRSTLILILWVVLICCVVVGSLSPAASHVMAAVGRLHINDKVMHFCAYLALSVLPVIGFRNRRTVWGAPFTDGQRAFPSSCWSIKRECTENRSFPNAHLADW